MNAANQGIDFLIVEFPKLAQHDIVLAESLLETPEDVIQAAEYAISKFDLGNKDVKIVPRFKDLPASSRILIRNIRSKHINKIFELRGIVRQKSDVRPQVTSARFECPSCGNIIPILQLDQKFQEPNICKQCGRKGRFALLTKDLVDAQKLVLEEDPEEMDGGEQPKRLNIFLKNDLVSPMSDKKTNPGSKIIVSGIIKEVPIVLHAGGKSTRFDLMIDANYTEGMQEEFTSLKISAEKKKEIIELSKDPQVYEKLVSSIAPTIYGHDRIKEALVLQMFGGRQKQQDDGVKRRGDIHVLLIGDPGSGKCISGDTKIMLQNGEIKKIKDFAENRFFNEENYVDDNILLPSLNFDGGLYSGTACKIWKRKEKEKLLKITLRSGKEIQLTKNHPLFYSTNGLIIAKEADGFKVGEHIATPRVINISGELQQLSNFKQKKYANNSKIHKLPLFLNKDVSRILGYLCGDGCLRYTKTSGAISFTNADSEILKDYETKFKQVFGAKLSTRSKKESGAKEIVVHSKNLLDYFRQFAPELVKKAEFKDVPSLLLKSPNAILREFIAGLFECDAHVNVKKRQIEYCTISKELAQNLQIALSRFGVVSFMKTKTKCATNTTKKIKVVAYELILAGDFLKKYDSNIGLISSQKSFALKKILQDKKISNTNVDIVPEVNGLLADIRKKQGLLQKEMGVARGTFAHFEQNNKSPSVNTLKKIVKHLYSKGIYTKEVKQLAQIAVADIFWDEIINIEYVKNTDSFVYDFEVQSTHNYVANGVVIHNSQLLKRVSIVAPKSRFVSGKGASGAGLTAAVVRDEFIRGWALEAGALVLANKGLVCIDELDKMTKEDTSAMHEALEQQTINISKANIQATLRAETTVLAAANPKFGRFDPYDVLVKQIDLPPTLINRFDLIFPIKDLPNPQRDEMLASFILKLHKDETSNKVSLDSEMIKLYIAYAKQHIHPVLTDQALKEIKDYFVSMRNSGGDEEKIQSIPISARQLEGLVRLSEASAKTRLSDKVTKKDAKRAIDLLHHCLTLIGLDTETGKFDIDRIATGITASQRGNMHIIKEIITELEGALNVKAIPIEDVIREAEIKGIPESKVEEIIEGLKRKGDLFSPKHGVISRM